MEKLPENETARKNNAQPSPIVRDPGLAFGPLVADALHTHREPSPRFRVMARTCGDFVVVDIASDVLSEVMVLERDNHGRPVRSVRTVGEAVRHARYNAGIFLDKNAPTMSATLPVSALARDFAPSPFDVDAQKRNQQRDA